MSYRAYKDHRWTVTHATPDSKCQPGDHIKFEGPPNEVLISRNGEVAYLPGMYTENNAVERSNDYVILMTRPIILPPSPPHQIIHFTPTGSSGSSGGSWTADDSTPPGPEEG